MIFTHKEEVEGGNSHRLMYKPAVDNFFSRITRSCVNHWLLTMIPVVRKILLGLTLCESSTLGSYTMKAMWIILYFTTPTRVVYFAAKVVGTQTGMHNATYLTPSFMDNPLS